jgi:hypothetical protein
MDSRSTGAELLRLGLVRLDLWRAPAAAGLRCFSQHLLNRIHPGTYALKDSASRFRLRGDFYRGRRPVEYIGLRLLDVLGHPRRKHYVVVAFKVVENIALGNIIE